MIKYLLILINSFFFFVYGIFNGDNGISITSNFPETMVAGREIPVEITVNKGAMNGFAKLQIELPSDFTVKESEEKGASYSYNDGIAKWVWAALPTENEIVIKMVIVPSESSRGPKTITAKYSYVENNVKQVVEMSPAEINVVGEGEAPVVTAAPVKEEPKSDSTPVAAPAELPAPVTSNIETPGAIHVARKSAQVSANEYLISMAIAKGNTKGFARYSDELPADVIVKNAVTDGASFSVADGRIKFVWVTVPDRDSLHISYTMVSSRTQAVELKGEYSYLEDNQSKKFKVETSSILFEIPSVAAGNKTAEPEVKKEEPSTATQEKTVTAEPVAKVEKPATAKKQVEKKEKRAGKTKTAAPKSTEPVAVSAEGMLYHVQIGAFAKIKSPAQRLERKFKVSESIISDMQGGFSKFMVGNHNEYKEARDHRENMISENGIKSAFVVAYNQGKRITVQEALSISNQKWFK